MLTRYLIVGSGAASVDAETIQRVFPDNHHELVAGSVWAVAGQFATCADVCKAIGLGSFAEESELTGVVVRLTDYDGYSDRALWERLRTWAANGQS